MIHLDKKTSRTAGLLYLLTFVSIPTLVLYGPVKGANYILSSQTDTQAIVGGILEIIIALAGIGTAVVLYPALKKQNESAALGLVAARILESATIFVGVAFLSTIVSMHQQSTDITALPSSHTLAMLYDRIFLLGQSFMPAICDMLLGYLLYKSGAVPKKLAVLGMIAGPILLGGYFAILFNLTAQRGSIAGLSALPVAAFEFSLGIYLIVKSFSPKAK